MNPIQPYKIEVYNRITGRWFAEYCSNQVPAKGDKINVFASIRNPDDPFDLWGRWVVDEVVWMIAASGSQSAMRIARESNGELAEAFCDRAEVHVWPAQGPHWAKLPGFAKALMPTGDDCDNL